MKTALLISSALLITLVSCRQRLDYASIELGGTEWKARSENTNYSLTFGKNADSCILIIAPSVSELEAQIDTFRYERGNDFINLYFYRETTIVYIGNFLSKNQLAVSNWSNGSAGGVFPVFKKM
jgi:hypothetical protein